MGVPDAVLPMGRSDGQLVKRMLAGCGEAFEEFFDSHFASLFRFALTRLEQDEEVADEVVQKTLCKAVDRLESYRGEAALFSWLCMICRHEITDHYRRTGRRPRAVPLREEVPEIRAALELLSASESASPETELQKKEIARWVRVTLDNLSPRYRQALEWKYVQGLSVKEIAPRLGVGFKAAESILTRSRQAFQQGFQAISAGQRQWAFG